MVEASHEKENRAKETIQQLKLEISNLSRLVEQGMCAARDSAPPSPASVRHAQARARARGRIHGRRHRRRWDDMVRDCRRPGRRVDVTAGTDRCGAHTRAGKHGE
jgi:hypothetical protein